MCEGEGNWGGDGVCKEVGSCEGKRNEGVGCKGGARCEDGVRCEGVGCEEDVRYGECVKHEGGRCAEDVMCAGGRCGGIK